MNDAPIGKMEAFFRAEGKEWVIMAKFCMKCGASLEENVKFCKACGAPVDGIVKIKEPSQPARVNQTQSEPVRTTKAAPAKTQSSNKGIIVILVLVIIVLCGGGGYYYYHTQQIAAQEVAAKAAEQKAAEEKAAAEEAAAKEAAEKEAQAKKKKITAYARAAISELNENEETLSTLAANINSGRYVPSQLLRMATNVSSKIEKNRNNMKNKEQVDDATLINEVDELFSIQSKRASCMSKGIQGETDQYRIGGNYYDEYQSKFNAFKQKYGI